MDSDMPYWEMYRPCLLDTDSRQGTSSAFQKDKAETAENGN